MRIKPPAKSGSALILAGGKSRRFGTNKAFVDFGGTTLIEYIILQLKPHFRELIISAENSSDFERLKLAVYPDLLEEAGPLAGIHAGLKAASTKWVFITACDMPFVSNELITSMQRITAETASSAVVAGRKGFIEPFHGFYSKELIPIIERAAANGPCGIFKLLKMITPEIIECNDESIFLNINTPEDLQKITT